jgi:ribosomal protein S18 acetylase RimI-like enzyme
MACPRSRFFRNVRFTLNTQSTLSGHDYPVTHGYKSTLRGRTGDAFGRGPANNGGIALSQSLGQFETNLGVVQVELAGKDDVDAIAAILNGAGDWLLSRGINQWPPGCFIRQNIAEAAERRKALVVKLHGTVIATFALAWEPTPMWGPQPADAGYIRTLAIARVYAGHQIGLSILRWAEREVAVEGRRFLRLDCMADNPGLRDYYSRAGFTFRGEVRMNEWCAALFEREIEQP